MLDVTGFNEYNIKLNNVIGNDTRYTKIQGGVINGVVMGMHSKNFTTGRFVMTSKDPIHH